MSLKRLIFTVFGIALGAVWVQTAPAEVTVDPVGFAVSVEADDSLAVEMTLANSGEADVAFDIGQQLIVDEDERRVGPRRDDLGDVIDEFIPPQAGVGNQYVTGMAWDPENEWMWLTESGDPRIVAVDPGEDYEEVERFNAPEGISGVGMYDGVLYGVGWINHTWVFRVDIEGNNLGNLDLNVQSTVGACTASREEG